MLPRASLSSTIQTMGRPSPLPPRSTWSTTATRWRVAGNGLFAARAWAIPLIRTDLVAMFDDDDLMLEDHIGRLARHIRDGADICSTGYWYADPDPTDPTKLVARRRQLFRPPRLGDLLVGYQPVNDGAMMRTSVAQSVVWDPGREILTMYHVWLQLLIADRRFVANRSATFLYRQHAASMSHNLGEREALLKAQLLEEFRARATERFGRVPPPSLPVRLRLARSLPCAGDRPRVAADRRQAAK